MDFSEIIINYEIKFSQKEPITKQPEAPIGANNFFAKMKHCQEGQRLFIIQTYEKSN